MSTKALHVAALALLLQLSPPINARRLPIFQPKLQIHLSRLVHPSDPSIKYKANNLSGKRLLSIKECRKNYVSSALHRRGGSDGEDDFDYEEDSEIDEDEFDFDMDEDGFNAVEGDFGEDGTVAMIVEMWRSTPPFTKAYLSAALAASTWGWINHKNQFPPYFTLHWNPVLTKLQIWRPFTAFLNFGPFGFSFFLTGHFVWTYMATLEKLSHSKPYDFWMMIIFGMVSMVVGYAGLRLSPTFLGHNLSTYLVYIWSRMHEGLEVSMMDLFNIRAEMLPWFFIAQTALLEGELPLLDMLGLGFGHIYYHLKTTNILRTPKVLIEWYNGDSGFSKHLREQYKTISADFELQ
eukprot:CAMPEP_0194283630 /NCGR_PEP_ID=MMETSP0169-20130528/25797_1 /TAXON_ID=218684 /ORGANISM="Corethron pennatum, Strain L29A3" /LENGTH=348 /DNA_ID=CAMNT_0039029267 /DNA_START=107 /DNA_END=1153 /DNA_ORIENTATION=-